jgi:TfoX/Sxy family transcriptional regulator of competence genes
MTKADDKTYADNLVLYEKMLAIDPLVQRKGATMPYTSLNGNMYSLFTREGRLILRLSPGDAEKFLKKHKSKVPEMYGAVMKEYVEVPDALLKKSRELRKVFDLSYAYAASLKPKATKKKPAKKKS